MVAADRVRLLDSVRQVFLSVRFEKSCSVQMEDLNGKLGHIKDMGEVGAFDFWITR